MDMMCTCGGPHVLMTTAVVMMVSTVVGRSSSYLWGQGLKASELWPHFRNTCNLTCPYGYQTDVEGNIVCHCYDPCMNVRCFLKTQCVVELPKICTGAYCRARATCKETSVSQNHVTQHGSPQADDAATTSSETSYPDRCLLQMTDEAKNCRIRRLRWYFDSESGMCKYFQGCRTQGNNFKRRRGCEKTCLGSSKAASSQTQAPIVYTSASSLQPDGSGLKTITPAVQGQQRQEDIRTKSKVKLAIPFSCNMAVVPVTTGCSKVRWRWYFDTSSGTCRKFWSCSTAGNNFRKKRHCTNRCLRQSKTSRRKGRQSLSRPPNLTSQ